MKIKGYFRSQWVYTGVRKSASVLHILCQTRKIWSAIIARFIGAAKGCVLIHSTPGPIFSTTINIIDF